MNDFLLILSGIALMFVISLIVAKIQFNDCNHHWSRWQDPVKDQAWLVQFRVCEKCNQQEARRVQ